MAASDAELREEASHWLVRLRESEGDAQTAAAFDAWLNQSERHGHIYAEIEQNWRDLDALPQLAAMNIDALIEEADREDENKIVALPERKKKPVIAVLSGLAAAFAIGFVTLSLLQPAETGLQTNPIIADQNPIIGTDYAEIREVALEDGSVVTLGARSKIETDFSGEVRRVVLSEGEAFFDVSTDPSRPFHVEAGDAVIRVFGTEFDVKYALGDVQVAVREGLVGVTHKADLDGPTNPISVEAAPKQMLSAGEKLVMAAATPSITALDGPTEIDIGDTAAWMAGRLVYDNARLEAVIADANRYSPVPIEFSNEDLKELRVVGAFRSDQIDMMLAGLATTQPVRVDRSASDRIVLREDTARQP